MLTALDYALALAAVGMKVFPLRDAPDKRPRSEGWQEMATTDEATIRRWFQIAPQMNYGITTGEASGVWVLDVDPKKGGDATMLRLAEEGKVPSHTFEVSTGSGGSHLYYRHRAGLRNRGAFLGPGVDARGDKGYVVGPGCRNESGPYSVACDADIVEMPEWLAEAAARAKEAESVDESDWAPAVMTDAELAEARRRALEAVRALPPGKEGDGGGPDLLMLCRDLFRGWGLPDDAVTRAIINEYCARCEPPWEKEDQIEHKIRQGKEGVRDPQGRGVGYLLAEVRMASAFTEEALDAQPREVERNPRGLRIVRITTKEGDVVEEVIAAMAERNGVYVRNDQLVAVFPGELPGDRRRVLALPKASVRGLIAQCCDLVKYDARQEDWIAAHPPTWLVEAVYARYLWPDIPPLTDFADAPCLRADGTVIEAEGYDKASGVYYAPSPELKAALEAEPVPTAPTREEARAAAEELLDLVCDFPFAEESHRSAWMASLLTQFCRPAIKGSIPMVLIDGNNRGAGKTLLADVVSHVAVGHSANKTPPTKDPEELRKQFSSAVLAGDTMLCLDNVVGEVGGPALDSALTNDGRWSDRILGGNTRVDKVVRMTIFATGNNLALRDDLVRRLLYVRLDSPDERPEKRTGFKHKLPEKAAKERARYVRAALTILRAYRAAGAPAVELPEWGSFSSWSEAVRAPMVWCGLPDPVLGRRQLEEEVDEEPGNLELLVHGLLKLQERKPKGFTSSEVVQAVTSFLPEERVPALSDALEVLCATRPGAAPTAKQVGNVLRRYRGKPTSGYIIAKARLLGREKIWIWKVVPAKSAR